MGPFWLSCILTAAVLWCVANLAQLPSSSSTYRAAAQFHTSVATALPDRPAQQAELDVLFKLWNRGSISEKVRRALPSDFVFAAFKDDPHPASGLILRFIAGTLTIGSLAFIIHVILWGRLLSGDEPDPEQYRRAALTTNICLACCIGHGPLLLMALDFYSHLFSFTVYSDLYLTPTAVSNTTLITLAALSFVIYLLVVLHRRWRHRLRSTSPTHCPKCNYEQGTFDTCPECGTPRSAPTAKLSKAKRRTLIAGYAAIPLLLIAPFWISWIDIAVYHIRH